MPIGKLGRDLGPCLIYWSDDFVGESFGDVTTHYVEAAKDIHEDSKGVSPVDSVMVGHDPVIVDIPFTRLSLLQLQKLIHEGDTGGDTILDLDNLGQSMNEAGIEHLTIKPIVGSTGDPSDCDWIIFHYVFPILDPSITFNTEGQRVFMVHFHCFPSTVIGEVWRVGHSVTL